MGSSYKEKYLGTFGECGTFSFYFSHHITTIEGGIVVTDDFHTYELLKCIRAHGWTRNVSNNYEKQNHNQDFCFINMGYNLRPMEIQGAMGKVQLKKLPDMNQTRIHNFYTLKQAFESDSILKQSFQLFQENTNCICAWFAFPILVLNNNIDTKKFTKKLNDFGIDTRPIVTGNFTLQPVFEDLNANLNLNIDPEAFANANVIHNHGFFIGISTFPFSQQKIEYIVNCFQKSLSSL